MASFTGYREGDAEVKTNTASPCQLSDDEETVQNLEGKGSIWQGFYSIMRKIKFLSSKSLRFLSLASSGACAHHSHPSCF